MTNLVIENCHGCPLICFMNRKEICVYYKKDIDCSLDKKPSFCRVRCIEIIEEEKG